MGKVINVAKVSISGTLLASLTILMAMFIQYISGNVAFEFITEISILTILKSFTICVATAFFEEYIFRVFLLRHLCKVTDKVYIVILIGSLIFAAAHAANSHFTSIAFASHFAGGLIYSYAYLKTKQIWLPFGLHLGWNYTQAVLGMPVSGTAYNSVFSTTIISDVTYSGGLYGFEGGIISIIARAALILTLAFVLKDKYNFNDSATKITK